MMGYLEATIVLAPMEPLFLPMMLTQAGRRRAGAWVIAGFLLAGNVLGALTLYTLGVWLAEPVILPLIDALGMMEGYDEAVQRLKSNGFAALFVVSITPFPFQAGVAAAGVVGYSAALFTAAVFCGRGLRYFGLALLVTLLGDRANHLVERYETHIFVGGLMVFALFCVYLIFL